MIQRVSDQNRINSVERETNKPSFKNHVPEMKKSKKKSVDRSWEVSAPANKLSNNDSLLNARSIRSAQTGSISDHGGPNQHVKMNSENSIFSAIDSSNKVVKTSKERTVEEKNSVAKVRLERQSQWKESNSPRVGEPTETSSTISRADCQEGSKGWVPSHKMSMFDTKEFERLAAPEGESIKKKVAQKDNSWREPTKAKNMKDSTSSFVDNMLSDQEGRIVNNRRESSTDRLFNVLKKTEN